MAIDFNAYLDRKYNVLEQRANTDASVAKNLGMPATAQPTPSSGPAQPPPDNSDQRAFDFGLRDGVSNTSTLDELGIGTTSSGMGMFKIPGLKKGIARVPGKGDGTKDTVKAKLAPGEAVLNKAAADGMGRGLISALNKMGAKKMGLV